MDRPNTFRLEPSLYQHNANSKPWTIECSSHQEMELWFNSIHHRLSLAPVFNPPPFLPAINQKKCSSHHHFFKKTLKSSSSTPIIPTHATYTPIPSLSQLRRGVIIPSSPPPTPEASTSLHPLDLPTPCTTSVSPYYPFE